MGGWSAQFDPNDHDGLVQALGGLLLGAEVVMPDWVGATPSNRADPMVLEAGLAGCLVETGIVVPPAPVLTLPLSPVLQNVQPALTPAEVQLSLLQQEVEPVPLQAEPQLLVSTIGGEATGNEAKSLPRGPLLHAALACPCSPSLLGLPTTNFNLNAVASPLVRRSGWLAAKKKGSNNVGSSRQASLLLQWKFDSDPVTCRLTGAAKESYNNILSAALNMEAMQAIRALARVDGKAQIDLPAMGLSADDVVVLAKEVAVA